MANIVTTQTILDGSRNTIIKVTILGDGSGELTNQIIFDSSAYANDTQNNKLWRIQYNLNGFGGTLYWDATTDVQLMSLTPNYAGDQKFFWNGGLVNNAGVGKTGDILLTTSGLGSIPQGTGEIILYVKKKS